MRAIAIKTTKIAAIQLIILLFALTYAAQTHAKGQRYVPPQHHECGCDQ